MPSNVSVTVKSVVWILLTVVSFSDVTGLHLLTGLSGSPPIWLQPQMSFSSLYLFIFTHCHIKKLSKNTLTGHACIPEFTHLFLAPWLPVLTPLFLNLVLLCIQCPIHIGFLPLTYSLSGPDFCSQCPPLPGALFLTLLVWTLTGF